MRVHLTQPATLPINEWEQMFVPELARRLGRDPKNTYELVNDGASADLIVMLEPNTRKSATDVMRLLEDPNVAAHADRVCTVNYEVHPAGFLPGLYTNLTRRTFEAGRHRSWTYLFLANGFTLKKRDRFASTPSHLYTFRGAISHPVRDRLAEITKTSDVDARFTIVDRWFDHTEDEQRGYVDEILDSHFVLCPRGLGPASHRLFEVMAMGRCPVIISDEWLPIECIDWAACSIRVDEARVDEIPALLDARRADAPELGRNARHTFKEYFSPKNGPRRALDTLRSILVDRSPDHDERAARRSWVTRDFFERAGWTYAPAVAARLEKLIE